MDIVDMFYHHTPVFLDRACTAAVEKNISLRGMIIDHVCVRLSSLLDYERANKALERYGAKVIGTPDAMIGGRPITVWKMPLPIIYYHDILDKEQPIDTLEVPAPKENHLYEDGIQHAELCPRIPPPLHMIQEYITTLLEQQPPLTREKHFMSRYNPTISYSFDRNTELKLHPYALEQVIKREHI